MLPQVFKPEQELNPTDILFLSYIRPRYLHSVSTSANPKANPFHERRLRYSLDVEYRKTLRQKAVFQENNGSKQNRKPKEKLRSDELQIDSLIELGESVSERDSLEDQDHKPFIQNRKYGSVII